MSVTEHLDIVQREIQAARELLYSTAPDVQEMERRIASLKNDLETERQAAARALKWYDEEATAHQNTIEDRAILQEKYDGELHGRREAWRAYRQAAVEVVNLREQINILKRDKTPTPKAHDLRVSNDALRNNLKAEAEAHQTAKTALVELMKAFDEYNRLASENKYTLGAAARHVHEDLLHSAFTQLKYAIDKAVSPYRGEK